jgi:hypothetical protein
MKKNTFRSIGIFILFYFDFVNPSIKAQAIIEDLRFGTLGMDRATKLIPTKDKGFLIIGAVYSNSSVGRGKDDILVSKLDADLKQEWMVFYGGEGNDHSSDILETEEGYLIVGSTDGDNFYHNGLQPITNKGGQDCFLLQIDLIGDIKKIVTYGGSGTDYVSRILKDNSGYLVGGVSNTDANGDKAERNIGSFDYWLFHLNDNFQIDWQETIGGRSDDRIDFMGFTSNGNILVGGNTWSGVGGDKTEPKRGGSDIWGMEVDRTGVIQWQQIYGARMNNYYGSISSNSVAGDFLQLKDEFILLGGSQSTICGSRQYDGAIYRIGTDGKLRKELNLFAKQDDWFTSIVKTADGGYMIAGTSTSEKGGHKTESSRGYRDAWVLRFDAQWRLMWDKTFGGKMGEGISKIVHVGENEYLLLITTESDQSGDITTREFDTTSDILIVKLMDNMDR